MPPVPSVVILLLANKCIDYILCLVMNEVQVPVIVLFQTRVFGSRRATFILYESGMDRIQ